jgi:hypothetical protein
MPDPEQHVDHHEQLLLSTVEYGGTLPHRETRGYAAPDFTVTASPA